VNGDRAADGSRVPRRIATSWLVAMALACDESRAVASAPRVVRADEWRVVGRFPGVVAMAFGAAPDGTLFLSVSDGLFRALPGADSVWSRIATTENENFPIKLYAASRNVLFGVTRKCNAVFRWDEGRAWRALKTPASDSFWVEGHRRRCFFMRDVWGRGESDVFVATDEGPLLHFDGDAWRFEPPLPFPAAADPPRAQRQLWSVGGDDAQVIAGGSAIFRKREGEWSLVGRPDELPPDCGVQAAAAWRGDVVVAGGPQPCLARFANGRWTSLMPRAVGVRDNLYSGRAQSDGSMLFWSTFGEFVEVRGDSVSVYLLPELRGTRGAVASGPFLYFAGDIGDTATVVRITRSLSAGHVP